MGCLIRERINRVLGWPMMWSRSPIQLLMSMMWDGRYGGVYRTIVDYGSRSGGDFVRVLHRDYIWMTSQLPFDA